VAGRLAHRAGVARARPEAEPSWAAPAAPAGPSSTVTAAPWELWAWVPAPTAQPASPCVWAGWWPRSTAVAVRSPWPPAEAPQPPAGGARPAASTAAPPGRTHRAARRPAARPAATHRCQAIRCRCRCRPVRPSTSRPAARRGRRASLPGVAGVAAFGEAPVVVVGVTSQPTPLPDEVRRGCLGSPREPSGTVRDPPQPAQRGAHGARRD